MTIHVRQTSPSASEATIRGHAVAIDRPVDKGGTDIGPMGGELFLAAVGGCFISNLLAAIRSREADVANVRADVAGTIEGAPANFSKIELFVSADCPDRALVEKLVEIAKRSCIMVSTLRGKIDLNVQISEKA